MNAEDELHINEISKRISQGYAGIRYTGASEPQIMQEIAWKVERCARMAGIYSNDKGTWLCWMASAINGILLGAGLTHSDIGMMMTKEGNADEMGKG